MATRLRDATRVLCLALLLWLSPQQGAVAAPVHGVFGGSFDYVCGDLDPFTAPAECGDYGLGIGIGDQFLGSFAFDSDSGALSFFEAAFAGQLFLATNLALDRVDDGVREYFAVTGQLEGGLFMSVGLTRSGDFPPSLPPLVIDESDWVVRAFKISTDDFPAIESGACPTNSVGGCYSSAMPGDFFLRTFLVSEPSTLPLLCLGVAALALIRRRKQQLIA